MRHEARDDVSDDGRDDVKERERWEHIVNAMEMMFIDKLLNA